MKRAWLNATGALLVAVTTMASAQQWPQHSIRMLIPAGPGGAVDTVGRLLATRLTASLGQPVVPENHPGAATMLASDMVAKAKPDGYTLVVITGSHAINAAVRPKLAYEPVKDFAPVSLVATLPDLVVVNPNVPAKSLQELIDYARAHPGKLTVGSAGTGSQSHLEAELFKNMARVDLLHVPYKTGVESVTGIVAGQVDVLFFNAIGVAGQIKAGKLRPLAATGAHRIAQFPDVPTMAEAGVPGYDTGSWYGVLLPAGTPPAIVARLSSDIRSALKMADVQRALAATGAEIVGSTPEEMGRFLEHDIARWKDLVAQRPDLRVTD